MREKDKNRQREERLGVAEISKDSGKEKGKIGQNIREQKDDMKTRELGETMERNREEEL